jgi:ankyrin repeat protein
MIAAGNGCLDVVRCLVKELGADVHQATDSGERPFIFAARHEIVSVVQWLLTEGGASMDEHRLRGHILWTLLELEDADATELTSLLHTMTLLAAC